MLPSGGSRFSIRFERFTVLSSPRLCRGTSDYQKEVPFAYQKNGTIVEGVMDVVFREEDGPVVLDFKTDLLEKERLNSKLEHYKPQVKVYPDAIQTIFGQPPREVVFFFLHLTEPVSVK